MQRFGNRYTNEVWAIIKKGMFSNIYLHLECESLLELPIIISRNPLIHWVVYQIIFTLVQHRFMVWRYRSISLFTQNMLKPLGCTDFCEISHRKMTADLQMSKGKGRGAPPQRQSAPFTVNMIFGVCFSAEQKVQRRMLTVSLDFQHDDKYPTCPRWRRLSLIVNLWVLLWRRLVY